MKRLIESLESRTLMSVSLPPAAAMDLGKLMADAQAARAEVLHYMPVLHADEKALRADLVATHSAANNALLAKAHLDDLKCYLTLKLDGFMLLRVDSIAARKAFVDGKLLAAHPGNAVLTARVTADMTALQTAGSAVVAKIGTDAAACGAQVSADLLAITAANPLNTAVATDVHNIETDGGNFVSALGNDVKAIQADVVQLVSDLA